MDCSIDVFTAGRKMRVSLHPQIDATELLARCLQHEIDHLHGKLFIDHLGLLKKRAALKKWEKLRAGDKSLTRTVAPLEVAQHHHRDEEL